MTRFAFLAIAVAFGATRGQPGGLLNQTRGGGDVELRTPAPGDSMTARLTISYGGAIVYRDSAAGNSGSGRCSADGRWIDPAGEQSGLPHPQCATAGTGTMDVKFLERAGYTAGPDGSLLIAFAASCGLSPDSLTCGRALRFKSGRDETSGFGSLRTTDTEGRVWTVDLSQPLLNTSGNVLTPAGTVFEACNPDLGCHPGTMTWSH